LAFVLVMFLPSPEAYMYDYDMLPEVREALDAMTAAMPNMVTMQAGIFAGMALIPVIAGIIAEDIEKKSLRFLTMAGVNPMSYLFGVSGVILFASFLTSIAFSWIADFRGADFWLFTGVMMSGVTGSVVLGATIGVLTKNVQSAQGLSLPLSIILGFGPFIAQINDTAARVLHPIFTQQINVAADYLNGIAVETPLWQSFAIMWANVAVFVVLFAIVYRAKGIKE